LGSFITAQLALEHGREVFLVPSSPRGSKFRGGNQLIRGCTILTETTDDMFTCFDQMPSGAAQYRSEEPAPIVGDPRASVGAVLLELEITRRMGQFPETAATQLAVG